MKLFTNEPMSEILAWVHNMLKENDILTFKVLNPDMRRGSYAGESIIIDETSYIYRSYKA
jgi:hypothetical protein